jgi:hypothetical protein
MSEPVTIQSTDYWIKVVEMLQQNWALIEAVLPQGGIGFKSSIAPDLCDKCRLPVSDKPERCPNLNSAHTNQKPFRPPQQRFDSPSAAVQCGDSSAFVFRSESRFSGCFISKWLIEIPPARAKLRCSGALVVRTPTPKIPHVEYVY